ncbi:MAG: VOC family protein [Candidatus Binatia bacterium]
MLDHVSIGVRDLGRAASFYDAVLGTLGYRRCMEAGGAIGYGRDEREPPRFWVGDAAIHGSRAVTPGLGLHFAFEAKDRAAVRAFHAAALVHGARDNGAPGLRPEYDASFYGGFVIDPEGYKIEAVCRRPDPLEKNFSSSHEDMR